MSSGLAKLVELFSNFGAHLSPFVVVYPWEKGAKLRLGSYKGTLDCGWHFKIPLVDVVDKVSCSTTTMKGNPQVIGSKVFRWTAKFRICSVAAYTINVWDEENFLMDTLTAHCADLVSRYANSKTSILQEEPDWGVEWANMLRRCRAECLEGGFELQKLRITEQTSTVSVKVFTDLETIN